MSLSKHQLKNEYVYEDLTLCEGFPANIIDRIRESFELRHDDVLIAAYPRSGTTWTSEIVWLIMNQVNIKEANDTQQDHRIPFIEMDTGETFLPIDALEAMRTRRIIKTHLPYKYFEKELKTKKTKVLFVARNIKDTLVSLYHLYRSGDFFNCMTGPFSEFFELFKEKRLFYADWFDFILGYWNSRNDRDMLLVKYEDLTKDIYGSVEKIAKFLDVKLDETQIETIVTHVNFDSMQKNESVNKVWMKSLHQDISPYIRKGKVGDWKNYFTREQEQYIDVLYKQKMAGSGLDFETEV